MSGENRLRSLDQFTLWSPRTCEERLHKIWQSNSHISHLWMLRPMNFYKIAISIHRILLSRMQSYLDLFWRDSGKYKDKSWMQLKWNSSAATRVTKGTKPICYLLFPPIHSSEKVFSSFIFFYHIGRCAFFESKSKYQVVPDYIRPFIKICT